jgi:hypothetical protein
MVDTGGSLLGNTKAVLQHLGVFLVDESGEVTTVIENKVEFATVLEGCELLL